MSAQTPAKKNCRSDRTGNIIVHRRVRRERRERKFLIISAYSAVSAVKYLLEWHQIL